ncbi:MAG: riboflavin synthase [Phycisphaerae bacterium]
MFSGIVAATGKVRRVERFGSRRRLAIDISALGERPAVGASVSVSGVCLTVAAVEASVAEFDVVAETLERSNLGRLRPGEAVNLELALRASDRLDGHLVQGHVDGTATVRRIGQRAGQRTVWFRADQPERIMPYVLPRGSVAVEGVSLTVVEVEGRRFSAALIPTTLARTTLGRLGIGDVVNVETDLLVRAVLRRLEGLGQSGLGLTMRALQTAGFA